MAKGMQQRAPLLLLLQNPKGRAEDLEHPVNNPCSLRRRTPMHATRALGNDDFVAALFS